MNERVTIDPTPIMVKISPRRYMIVRCNAMSTHQKFDGYAATGLFYRSLDAEVMFTGTYTECNKWLEENTEPVPHP